jgi:hypothetical protein
MHDGRKFIFFQDARGLLDALSNSASDDAKKEEAMIKLFLSTKEVRLQRTTNVGRLCIDSL